MIFWTTVLTFMIGLMITMLFPRNDRANVEELPVSEAYVASFVAQHQFARDYADQISFTLPYITPISGSDNPSGDAAYIHVFKSDFDDVDTGYMPDIMPDYASRETFPTDGSYTSAIVCMDALDKKISSGETETNSYGKVVSCQTPQQTFKYVLTYGALFPENTIQHNLFKSRIDTSPSDKNKLQRNHILWEKALSKRTKGDPDCGYMALDDADEPHIFSVDGQKREVPYNLFDLFVKNNYFPGGSDDSEDVYDYQPIFCITPVNSPYVSDGLIYHFDSVMNNKSTQGAPLHNDTKAEWLDIISQTAVTFLGSTSSNSSWHPDDEMPLSMMGDIYFNLPITGDKKITTEFTISFVVNFDQYTSDSIITEAPIFSTNSGSYPYVLAKYKSGKLTVTVYQEKDVKLGEIETLLPHHITALSYVIGPRFHHIFVDGKKNATETFSDNRYFKGISSPTLSIAASVNDTTSKLNADMYNIKVYNRVLNEDEIKHNLKTEKKRYRF